VATAAVDMPIYERNRILIGFCLRVWLSFTALLHLSHEFTLRASVQTSAAELRRSRRHFKERRAFLMAEERWSVANCLK
jgi:hypothetical protein